MLQCQVQLFLEDYVRQSVGNKVVIMGQSHTPGAIFITSIDQCENLS